MRTEQGTCNHWIGAALDFGSSRLPTPPIGLQRGTGKPYASPPPDGFLKGESSMGESVSHKSSRRRADAQWIVTTRLLYHLHDPAELLSRMQRIYPRAPLNCNTPAGKHGIPPYPIAGLLRFRAKGLFVSMYGVRSGIIAFSGMDSDLEAFSHNPADGSFAALPCQTAAKTNYLNQRFLSY